MSFTADRFHESCVVAAHNSTQNEGYCVFCESHVTDVLAHHTNKHGGNANYEIFLYKYASIYLAPSGIFPDSELNNCERCKAILYNHRIKNHFCREQIDLFALDEGRGNEYCLMCQFRCDDVSVHWNEAHKSNVIYKIEEIQGIQTLLPERTKIYVDLEYFYSHDNHELCQRFTYKKRIRRPCDPQTTKNENNSIADQPNLQFEPESDVSGLLPLQSGSNLSFPTYQKQCQGQEQFSSSFAREYRQESQDTRATAKIQLQTNGNVNQMFFPHETSSSSTGIENVEHAGQGILTDPIVSQGSSQGARPNEVESKALHFSWYWDENNKLCGYCVICHKTIGNIYNHSKHESVEMKPFNGRRVIAPVGSFEKNELSKCEACKRVFHSKNIPDHDCEDTYIPKRGAPKIFNDEKSSHSGFCVICETEFADLKRHSIKSHEINKPYPWDIRPFKGRRILALVDSFEEGKLTKCEICNGVFLTERFHNHN